MGQKVPTLYPRASRVDGVGTSTLVRNDNGVAMTIHTVGLPAGTADTVWWVIFNNPSACSHGMGGLRCGAGDLSVPAVKASVQSRPGTSSGLTALVTTGPTCWKATPQGALRRLSLAMG